MTITDTGRRSAEQLLTRAREVVGDGPMPSKSALQKALGVAWDRAVEVHTAVSRERDEARAQRRRKNRATIRQLPRRKRARRTPAVALLPFPTPSEPVVEPVPTVPVEPIMSGAAEVVGPDPGPAPLAPSEPHSKPVVTWPALLVAAPAAVAIWAGWVAIGKMTGFGPVNLLPGFGGGLTVDTAITLPVGVEAYAGYAFYVALHPGAPWKARVFAGWSAALAVLLGMGGQTAYHLMSAAGMQLAPWQITTVVSCLPVAVFGLTAALIHMVRNAPHEEGKN